MVTSVTPVAAPGAALTRGKAFPALVFMLTFALLLSDHMSRQVLAAIFPMLKTEWGLSDTRLATLNSVVSLTVAVFAIPLSVVGDKIGRGRAVVMMAVVWSLATVAAAFTSSYGQILATRVVVGFGEAAYGSIGLAVMLGVNAPHRRSTLTGAFLAGASIGSVLGVGFGGVLAQQLGWRAAFAALGVAGLALAGIYAIGVTERRIEKYTHPDDRSHAADDLGSTKARFATLVRTPSVVAAYLASGVQLLVPGAMYAWLPSLFNRSYAMAPGRAGAAAAGIIAVIAVGMVVTGAITDRVSREAPARKWVTSIGYALITLISLGIAFRLPPGAAQIGFLVVGGFFCAGIAGPAGALVANLTAPSVRATAFAALSLANNLLGLAMGPFLVGVIADRSDLTTGFGLIPFASVVSIGLLLVGWRCYPASLAKVSAIDPGSDQPAAEAAR